MNKSVSEMTAGEALDTACDYIERLSEVLDQYCDYSYEQDLIKEAETFAVLVRSRLSNWRTVKGE